MPLCLSAQESPVLRAAIQLAAEGRADSARGLVDRELARVPQGQNAWVEALYVRARLAGDGAAAERDLRRVAIEHPQSPWADDALLQLSQLALAAGNPAGALALAARVRSDYPGSELRPRAAVWAGRAAFEVGEPWTACALLDSARAEAAADIEFINQVDFYRARCTDAARTPPAARPAVAATRDSAQADSAPVAAGRQTPASYWVQVGASRDSADARRLAARHPGARVIGGADGYHRVRLGPFTTSAEAEAAARDAQRRAGGQPFVVSGP